MTSYEDLKKHCENVPVNHMGMRIACVQADTILELIKKLEDSERHLELMRESRDKYYQDSKKHWPPHKRGI